MAGNSGSEGLGDDFFEQILAVPEAGTVGMLQLGSTTGAFRGASGLMPLGLNLEQAGFLRHQHQINVDDVVHVNVDDATIHQHHLTLHNNNNSSSPSSTAPITVCTYHAV